MIRFDHVSAAYAVQTPVVRDASFTIDNGEFVAFVGTNGAGKSTTMRLCNGLLKPTAGQVLVDGVPTTELRTSELARQICCKTVREELEFGFRAQDALTDEARARVDATIERFGFDANAEPYLLNRGTRQLLALASIIVMEPDTIILDEPTTGLDFHECEKVMGAIADLHTRGKTIVMVCHDMEVVADYAERVIVMTAGEVVASGPTFEVLRQRAVLERAGLVAPQVVDVSLRLVERHPELAGTPIATANTLEETVAAIEAYAAGAKEAAR
jgi:energy-coupling factor transport system ATP-binding protein